MQPITSELILIGCVAIGGLKHCLINNACSIVNFNSELVTVPIFSSFQ